MTQAFYQVGTPSEGTGHGSLPYDMNQGVKGGTFRINQDGSSEALGAVSYDSTAPSYDFESEHPFANAKDNYGRSVAPHNLTAESIVKINGVEASLGQLEALGLVVKNSWGSWGFAPEEDLASIEQETDPNEGLDLNPQVLEDRINELIEPIPQPVYDMALAQFADTLDISKVDVGALAQASHQSDEKVKEGLSFIGETFSQQIKAELGEDTESILSWAKANKPSELKGAMRQLLMERSLTGIRNLASNFSSDCSTEAQVHKAVNYLNSKGISTRKSGNTWLVKTDQGEMSIEAAFRAGHLYWSNKSKK